MKRIFISFFLLFSFPSQIFSEQDKTYSPDESSFFRELLISHLRENFDDIHDVSMRFHHLDSSLNGLINFDLSWKEGRIHSFTVTQNETGNSDFAAELGAALARWHLPEIPDDCRFPFSLMIKIVGSDDPAFLEKAIFTGKVIDPEGSPVRGARIIFSENPGEMAAVPDGLANREGIFVRTLIPPGTWSVTVSCTGYRNVKLENIEFNPGEHRREKIVLQRIF